VENDVMSRWIRFLIAILAGIALGLIYGWVISPVRYVETSPDTLRVDYKADYVLMVAEAYQDEKDLAAALRRLALLGEAPPVEMVYQAVQFAGQYGYNDADLGRLQVLMEDLQALSQAQGTTAP
jgi:hypothetical protein